MNDINIYTKLKAKWEIHIEDCLAICSDKNLERMCKEMNALSKIFNESFLPTEFYFDKHKYCTIVTGYDITRIGILDMYKIIELHDCNFLRRIK